MTGVDGLSQCTRMSGRLSGSGNAPVTSVGRSSGHIPSRSRLRGLGSSVRRVARRVLRRRDWRIWAGFTGLILLGPYIADPIINSADMLAYGCVGLITWGVCRGR